MPVVGDQPVLRFIGLISVVVVLASVTVGQNVGDWACENEDARPNLELKERSKVFGQLNDPTGAPFGDSKVVLRRRVGNKFVERRVVKTDASGRFDLGVVDPGSYRFLPGPNRGWKQPKAVECGGSSGCEIKLVLELNPTDQPFAQCPIK
jgi:hypothetical protein